MGGPRFCYQNIYIKLIKTYLNIWVWNLKANCVVSRLFVSPRFSFLWWCTCTTPTASRMAPTTARPWMGTAPISACQLLLSTLTHQRSPAPVPTASPSSRTDWCVSKWVSRTQNQLWLPSYVAWEWFTCFNNMFFVILCAVFIELS